MSPFWKTFHPFYSSLLLIAVFGALAYGISPYLKNEPVFPLPNMESVRLSFGSAEVLAEVAFTPEKTALGLGGRESLKPDTGMIFVFPAPAYYGIWMKDMKFPIDIIWLDEHFSVVDMKENAEPSSYPEIFNSREKARFVFEVAAGFAEKNALKPGKKFEIK